MNTRNWTVQVPIDDIIALHRAIEDKENKDKENAQLRREIEGLRNMQHECMLLIGDLRRQLKSCHP